MPFNVGDTAWVINNYRNRVTRAIVTDVTTEDIEVQNLDKLDKFGNPEEHFFALAAPHRSLGDYWEDGEPRSELVEFDNAEATRLNDERIHREHAVRVRRAVDLAAKEPNEDSFRALRAEIARWAGHTLVKVAA